MSNAAPNGAVDCPFQKESPQLSWRKRRSSEEIESTSFHDTRVSTSGKSMLQHRCLRQKGLQGDSPKSPNPHRVGPPRGQGLVGREKSIRSGTGTSRNSDKSVSIELGNGVHQFTHVASDTKIFTLE
ncbi:hypothetical protein PoB_006075700 [Plakobranchus ocellatus]|uniref:CRIB domain-containing protein n=1 Tax=Plakobranchus ocellatus TaxID=259542 RepID=A0AAV4CQV4_9GAST|nr:hypothetical protein PoB_006075700 [Plakobranchus ocellatus]